MIHSLEPMSAAEHLLLEEVIETRFGLSYAARNRESLEARLRPRVRTLGLRRFIDYYLHLQYDPEGELPILAGMITNNETYFFRETYQFDGLFEEGIALLDEGRLSRTTELRILSAGCSSGEEPYTLSLYANDYLRQHPGFRWSIQAFDLDDERLTKAQRAVYSHGSLRNTDPEQLAAYFEAESDDCYSLRPEFRRGVCFRSGNLLNPEAYGPKESLDVIFCRNVLIYFSEGAFRKAIENFAQALRPNGLLFLGHSESLIGRSTAFETVRLENCIAYRRVGGV